MSPGPEGTDEGRPRPHHAPPLSPPRTHHGAGPSGKTHRASRPPQCQLQEKTGQAEEQRGTGPHGGRSTGRERPDGTCQGWGPLQEGSDGAPESRHRVAPGPEPTTDGTEMAEGGPGRGVPPLWEWVTCSCPPGRRLHPAPAGESGHGHGAASRGPFIRQPQLAAQPAGNSVCADPCCRPRRPQPQRHRPERGYLTAP